MTIRRDEWTARRNQTTVACCSIYIIFAFILVHQGSGMFSDSDTFWHMAAGDWIRLHGHLPLTDPWSFTAGDYRWLNISWAWDIAASYLHRHLDWYGPEAANTLIIAMTVALVYSACIRLCNNGLAAFLSVFFVLLMLQPSLRPLHITHLFTALWMLLLGYATDGSIRRGWLMMLPMSMVIWVNMHGGFFIGFLLIAAFWIQALFYQRNLSLTVFLTSIGFLCLIATLLNPYGIDIVTAVHRTLYSESKKVLHEWQWFLATSSNIINYFYLPLFFLVAFGRRTPAKLAERWLCVFWMLNSFISIRCIGIFAIISAPILAYRLALMMQPKHSSPLLVHDSIRAMAAWLSQTRTAYFAGLLSILFSFYLVSPLAKQMLNINQSRIPSLKSEINFLQTHYPKARILTHFDLGPILEYETQGTIPTFMDGRVETAYPPTVVRDYFAFEYAASHWEQLLEQYRIDGVMIPKPIAYILPRPELMRQFADHKGWHKAFDGPVATLFMRNDVVTQERRQ